MNEQLLIWCMDDEKKNVNSFAKYSSISFQMLATIGVFAFIGYKLDQYQKTKAPIYTAVFSLIGVVISLYQVVKQLNKKSEWGFTIVISTFVKNIPIETT